MRANELLNEIERLRASDYSGGKNFLTQGYFDQNKIMPLPGGSKFGYIVLNPYISEHLILLVDRTKKYRNKSLVIGKLTLSKETSFPLPDTYQVDTITVDEDYRGQGLATSLYGIALSILHLNLRAGDSQTPGGRSNWTRLSRIPGVEVVGYVDVPVRLLKTQKVTGKKGVAYHIRQKNEESEGMIDSIMMLGGEYLGKRKTFYEERHVFLYPVTVSNNELMNAISGSDITVYDQNWKIVTGLLARWEGN